MSHGYGRYGAERGSENRSWDYGRGPQEDRDTERERRSESEYRNYSPGSGQYRAQYEEPPWPESAGRGPNYRYRRSNLYENYNRGQDLNSSDFAARAGYSGSEPSTLGWSGYSRGPARSHLRCRDIMVRNVRSAVPSTPIRELARIMRSEDVGAVPIISEDGKLAGIVTDRDLIVSGLTKDKGDTELAAEDCMSKDVYTANLNDRVVDVIEQMGDHQVRRIPVVDNNDRLVGIVSLADVALASDQDYELSRALEDISKPSSWLRRLANFLGL